MKKKSTPKKAKVTSRDIFDLPSHPGFRLINHILAFTTIVSIAIVTLETVESLAPYHYILAVLEYAAVAIFTLEYIARIKLSKHPLRYIFSFFGLIDLIAILPSLLGLTNLTFLKAVRIVRIIRLLRMIRMAKFAEIEKKNGTKSSLYILNLEIYFISLIGATLLLGSSFYIFETQYDARNIPAGMYWALRIFLGGLTYPEPETLGGTITLMLAQFTSIVLLGMMLTLVGTMIRKMLIGTEEDA